jgi:hypothetical protein
MDRKKNKYPHALSQSRGHSRNIAELPLFYGVFGKEGARNHGAGAQPADTFVASAVCLRQICSGRAAIANFPAQRRDIFVVHSAPFQQFCTVDVVADRAG